jgi:hypothetical protein
MSVHDELIAAAKPVLNPRVVGDRLFGDLGCALVAAVGSRYLGVRHYDLPYRTLPTVAHT